MIEIKAKKCKGTGLAKGYGCGKLTKHRICGLGKMCCYTDWLLNSENGKIKLAKATLKVSKPRLDLEKAKKESKEKTITQLINDARKYFQKWIRKRDEQLPCISCGNFYSKFYDGGHFFKAELYTGLIFNEINCNKQCRKCNRYLSGNESAYRIGLIQKYGIKEVEKLERLSKTNRSKKFERDELKEIKIYYQNKLKK